MLETRRASLRIGLAHAIEAHAQAIVDAKRGGDEAGRKTAAIALRDLITAHQDRLAEIDDDPEEGEDT